MWNEEKLKQQLGESWYEELKHTFKEPYMKNLAQFLEKERQSSKTVLPNEDNIFHFFRKCPYDKVRVVLLGMDPAQFPSKDTIGIFREEIVNDLYEGLVPDKMNTLENISKQGVLILDTCLTYDLKYPFRHHDRGWERFIEYVIKRVNSHRTRIVFVVFGEFAQTNYEKFIDENYHKIINMPHPAHKESFKGTKPFSKINNFLRLTYNTEIEF